MTDGKNILSATADAILENPVRIDVDVLSPRWWEQIGMKLGLLAARRSFVIRPITLGNMIRISKLMLGVDVDVYRNTSALDANYVMISSHGETMATIIATAITNSQNEPRKSLVHFLLNNLTARELVTISSIVIKQLDVGSFMTTIVSIRGRNILETSHQKQGSQIASGEQ